MLPAHWKLLSPRGDEHGDTTVYLKPRDVLLTPEELHHPVPTGKHESRGNKQPNMSKKRAQTASEPDVPVPSPWKRQKTRRTRAAAQRALTAVLEEAQDTGVVEEAEPGQAPAPRRLPTRQTPARKKKVNLKPPARAAKESAKASFFPGVKEKNTIQGCVEEDDGGDVAAVEDDEDEIQPVRASGNVTEPRGRSTGSESRSRAPREVEEEEDPSELPPQAAARNARCLTTAAPPNVPGPVRKTDSMSESAPAGGSSEDDEDPTILLPARVEKVGRKGGKTRQPAPAPAPECSSWSGEDTAGKRTENTEGARSPSCAPAFEDTVPGVSREVSKNSGSSCRMTDRIEAIREAGDKKPLWVLQLLDMLKEQRIETVAVRRECKAIHALMEDIHLKMGTLEAARAAPIPAAVGTGPRRASPRDSASGMNAYLRIMDKKAPHLAMYVPEAAWAHAVVVASVDHVWEHTPEELDVESVFKAVSGILLSRAGHGGKDIFKTEVGKQASAYRRAVLRNALALAREGTYPANIPASSDAVLEDTPFWLGKHGNEMYIEERHLEVAQLQFESKTANSPEYNRRVAIGAGADPNRDDIAVFVMGRMYKVMNDLFRKNRRKVSEDFCLLVGYLFVPWAPLKSVSVNEDTLRMRWVVAIDDVDPLPLERIRTSKTSKESSAAQSVEKWNMALYNRISAQNELYLFASHDILMHRTEIEGENFKRHNGGTVPRVFRRIINLLRPISVFLLSWAGLPAATEPSKLLRYHPQTMRVLYVLAYGLRCILDTHDSREIGDGLTCASQYPREWSKKEKDVADKFMLLFLPGATVVERSVASSTCAVPETFFMKENIDSDAQQVAPPAENGINTSDGVEENGGVEGAELARASKGKCTSAGGNLGASRRRPPPLAEDGDGEEDMLDLSCMGEVGGQSKRRTRLQGKCREGRGAVGEVRRALGGDINRAVKSRVSQLVLDDAEDECAEDGGGKKGVRLDGEATDKLPHSSCATEEVIRPGPRAPPAEGLILPAKRVSPRKSKATAK